MPEGDPTDAVLDEAAGRQGRAEWRRLVLPLAGLIILVALTALYALNRAEKYSTAIKASPPGSRFVGDDFLDVAVFSRDRRSVSLVIGQALYERRESVSRVLLPRDPQSITSIPGPVVKGSRVDSIRPHTIALLVGMEPIEASYFPRLSEKASLRLFREAKVTEYPMGVVVVEPGSHPGDSGARTEWVVVGDSSGTKIILAPVATVPELLP